LKKQYILNAKKATKQKIQNNINIPSDN